MYYTQENHGPYELINIGDLSLEEGGEISNCKLAVATFGELNEAKDNAILITTWYSGTNKIIEQVFIGEGRAFDPTKYFIIIVNQIGGGLSTSPSNADGPIKGSDFPYIRIGDDVRAQYALLTEHYGLDSLALVTGGSMGAQQTYEWSVRYPDFVKRAAPFAGTAKTTEHNFIFAETLGEAITSDPGYNNGNYVSPSEVAAGLKRHAKMWTVMGWSTSFFAADRYKELGFESTRAFVDEFMNGYFAPMDPNNLLLMMWKWQRADVSRHTAGDLAAALNRVKAKMFIMPISSDMFFPPTDTEAEQKLVHNSEHRILQSIDGHLGLFGTDAELIKQIDQSLTELLSIKVS